MHTNHKSHIGISGLERLTNIFDSIKLWIQAGKLTKKEKHIDLIKFAVTPGLILANQLKYRCSQAAKTDI